MLLPYIGIQVVIILWILVDGNWGAWTEFGDCSAECGDGTQSRTRTCSDPEPQFDGKSCEGDDTEIQDCKLKECPSNVT